MALLRELTPYRSKIMEALCSDQEIVDLINDKTGSPCPDRSLMYKRIYPYNYMPDTAKDTNTYICCRIYIYQNYSSKTTKDIRLVFSIFSHQSHIRTSNGLRPDLIAMRIESLFNGNLDLGISRIELVNMLDISPSPDFHGLQIEYKVREWNRPTINGDPRSDLR